jgi:pimeloyl-ACP methyl ester carboxylesterase
MMQDLISARPSEPAPSLARVPGAEEREVMIEGVTWRYWHAGSGPALLLIHGFLGYSFSWRFNVESLAQHFSVFALDLPGCGFSPRTDALLGSLAGDAEAVLRFMDHLGLEQADVVGSSRGGGVTIALAALAAQRGTPERIGRIILSAPINPWSSNGRFLTKLLATAIGGMYIVHVQPRLPFMLEKYFKGLYGDPKKIAPGSMEGYDAGLKPAGTFEHLLKIVRSWHRDLRHIEEALPAMADAPTLLLWGERDTAVYASSASELHRRLPNSAVLIMKGVGHLPYEEVPDEFNRIVCDFLLHHSPATPLEAAQLQPGTTA